MVGGLGPALEVYGAETEYDGECWRRGRES